MRFPKYRESLSGAYMATAGRHRNRYFSPEFNRYVNRTYDSVSSPGRAINLQGVDPDSITIQNNVGRWSSLVNYFLSAQSCFGLLINFLSLPKTGKRYLAKISFSLLI